MGQYSHDAAQTSSILPATERKQVSNRVLREINHNTSINMTVAGTDVSAGEAAIHNLGRVTRQSVGRYRATAQAMTNGVPLSTLKWIDFDIIESSAGVFVTQNVVIHSTEGGTAVDDDNDTDVLRSGGDMRAGNIDISGADDDSACSISVAAADEVSDMASAYPGVPCAVGDLLVVNALSQGSYRVTITRLS